MKQLSSLIGACLSTALLASCNGAGNNLSPSTTSFEPPDGAQRSTVASLERRMRMGPNLYVANVEGNTVTVYAPGKTSVLRTVSQGVHEPYTLAISRLGYLHVANNYTGPSNLGNVTTYPPGGKSLRHTITQGVSYPRALAFDASGDLYVADYAGSGGNAVTVYAPASQSVLRVISQGLSGPVALAFDASGNLYVANYWFGTAVTVYAPGSSSVLRTISAGRALAECARVRRFWQSVRSQPPGRQRDGLCSGPHKSAADHSARYTRSARPCARRHRQSLCRKSRQIPPHG